MVLLQLLSVPLFNLLKFLIASYLMTWVSSCVTNSLERLRRSYCLRHYGKVQIGGPTNNVIRCLGITTSPFALRLNLACVVLLFAVELTVETDGTNTVRVGLPQYGIVKLRQIEPFDVSSWTEERAGFKNDYVHCSFQNRTHILIWPTELIEENGRPRLLCPRNTTTQYLFGNEAKATVTNVEDLKQEMIPLKSAFGANVESIGELPHVATFTIPEPVRNESLGKFIAETRMDEHYLLEYEAQKGSEMLTCLVRRYSFSDRPNISIKRHVGCMFKAQSKHRFVLYHSVSSAITELQKIRLAPVAVTSAMNDSMLMEVLQRSFDTEGTERRWPRLIGAIITKMAEEGNLQVRPAEDVRRIVNIESGIRPVVEIWVLVVVPLLLLVLVAVVVITRRYAVHLFPYRELVGEDNMIRVWAREQRQGLRADPTGPSWLVLEDDGDGGKRLRAFIDEPGSRLLDRKVPIRGLM